MEGKVIAKKGEWEIHENEFKDCNEFAAIITLADNDFIEVKCPTTLEQYQYVASTYIIEHPIVLSNSERWMLSKLKGWEYYVNDKNSLKFKLLKLTPEAKEVWNNIVNSRLSV